MLLFVLGNVLVQSGESLRERSLECWVVGLMRGSQKRLRGLLRDLAVVGRRCRAAARRGRRRRHLCWLRPTDLLRQSYVAVCGLEKGKNRVQGFRLLIVRMTPLPVWLAVVILTSHSLPGIRWLWFLLGAALSASTAANVAVEAEHF